MVKTELRAVQTQRQQLSQQMRQALRLLALAQPELEAELREAALANPVLELEELGSSAPPGEEPELAEPAPHAEPAGEDWDPEPGTEEAALLPWPEPGAGEEGDPPEREIADPSGQDLKAHLGWQLSLSRLDARERLIAEVLIDAVDANGYLGLPLEEIEATLRARMPVARTEIEVVRAALRQFEPVGCASRDLGECLDAQLLAMDPALPGRDTARRIVRGHLELLAAGAHERIARRLGVTVEEVQRAAALIRSLEPRPGARFQQETAPGVIPDVIVRRQGRGWSVLPNPELSLRLTLNRDYLALATRSRGEDRAYLRERLREARWLMRCLAARQQTVLRVATAIFERQRGFLEHGPMALVPLAMREIAEKLGVHESTVSRAVAGKHALTPRGTFALGYFFASGVGTVEGGAASSTAVQEMIRRLIAEEDPRRPLSDLAIAETLRRRGIAVARRTVAKYREMMKIPSSHARQRPA